jgi:hypothetical protein
MSAAAIVKTALESRTIRKSIVSNGIRVLQGQNIQQSSNNNNILSVIFDWGKRLAGFILSNLKSAISWTASAIWGAIVSTSQYVWHFNWNATDEQLDQQIRARWNQIAGQFGGVVGQFLGWIACGVVPGAVTLTFNEVAGALILKQVGEEMAEELAASIAALIRSAFQATAATAFVWAFKNARKLIRNNSSLIRQVFGAQAEKAIQAWGTANSKPWSFAKATEEAIERIPNEALRNFTEEMLEEFFESCVEAGYVVANSIDSLVASGKFKTDAFGKQRVVEITPNREVPNERIILAGNEKVLMPHIVNTLSHYQLIDNRDIGVIIGGESYQELSRRRDPREITCIFEFATNNERPFFKPVAMNQGGQVTRIIRPQVTVSNVQRTKLDWLTLKQACGGNNGYNYGRHRCCYHLLSPTGGDRGSILVYAQSYTEAKNRCEAFLALTDNILGHSTAGEDTEGGNRTTARDNLKPLVKIYPYRVTICVGVDSTPQQRGRKNLTSPTARSVLRKAVIDLWSSQQPNGIEEQISALFVLLS